MTLDELAEFGMVRMNETEIRDFLANQEMGVLGLPSEDVPYLLPMSFGFDGESRLYFTYVLGASSRKEELSSHTERACFLVYSADTPFIWESVSLTGTLTEVSESEWDDVRDALSNAWRPSLFESASATQDVKIYGFRIEDRTGIKHTGLPPAFDREASDATETDPP
jgi:hypothetical protein